MDPSTVTVSNYHHRVHVFATDKKEWVLPSGWGYKHEDRFVFDTNATTCEELLAAILQRPEYNAIIPARTNHFRSILAPEMVEDMEGGMVKAKNTTWTILEGLRGPDDTLLHVRISIHVVLECRFEGELHV